jgi:acetyltransferase-like isoleucine patch superfamily enzyme
MIGGASIGSGSLVLDARLTNAYHYGLSKLVLGKDCFIGNDVDLDVRGGIIFGNQVTVSNRVMIVSHINVGYKDHPLQAAFPTKEATVTLKDGCYIGTGAIILPGITIGKMAVVGAGAVVTKDVEDRTVVGGIPARVLRTIKV